MNMAIIITISASACGFILSALLLVGVVLIGAHGGTVAPGQKLHRCFYYMILFNLIQSGCEIFTALLVGTPGRSVALLFRIVDFTNYAAAALMTTAFVVYLHEYLSMKTKTSWEPVLLVKIFSALQILLTLAAQLNGMFGGLDENNYYHATELEWVTVVFPFLSMLVFVFLTLKSRRALRLREWLSLLLYILIPVICYGIEIISTGIWISTLGFSVALFLIYINIQLELKKSFREKDRELTESRISTMISQIQPHFLYNSLSAIEKLCDIDHDKAKSAINDFAYYLRGNLNSIGSTRLIPFENELEHIEVYVGLEKLRFGDKLDVVYDIEEMDFFLPPLTVQPIVENAIRHGVTKKKGCGTVKVTVKKINGDVQITVADNGVGFDPNALRRDGDRHIGIDNVRTRISILCGGTLEIDGVPGKGTEAVLVLPFLPPPQKARRKITKKEKAE